MIILGIVHFHTEMTKGHIGCYFYFCILKHLNKHLSLLQENIHLDESHLK